MRVLVIGSGGREHALLWKLRQSPRVSEVYCAPGNAGIARMATCIPIAADDIVALRDWARANDIALTIPGPEAALVTGVVDLFEDAGLRIWGPSKAAARLEGSKSYAKQFMAENGIPTASYAVFDDYTAACRYVLECDEPLVIKADGLAAGKGVVVCNSGAEALNALNMIMVERAFGPAGERVVIEERLSGVEISVLVMCDGNTAVPLVPARDHKRLYDGGRGPNTGGMGAFAPAEMPVSTSDIMRAIIQPTLRGMASRGAPFTGILYTGLMLTERGAMVLEYNCRFGDPEAQVILPLLESDLIDAIDASIAGNLRQEMLTWHAGIALCVVLAAAGYPENPRRSDVIAGCAPADETEYAVEDVYIFHGGTAERDGQLVTAGGRVLGVTAWAETLEQARAKAYNVAARIDFDGKQYRQDIGVAQGVSNE